MSSPHSFGRIATQAALMLTAIAVASLPCTPADAQTQAGAKRASKSRRAAPPPNKQPPEIAVADATPEQHHAAELVYFGHYECEFNQFVDILPSPIHSSYVDVRHGKGVWLMRPVLSSTGAIRLEDVRNETLMVQIASKSMLLNVTTGRRVVDDCISPKQRELIEVAKAAKAAEAAAAATGATPASVPAPLLRTPTSASAPTS